MADYGLLIEVSSKGINKVDSELKSLNKTMEQTAKSSDKVEKGLSSSNVNKFSLSVKQANSEVSSLNNSFKTLGNLITTGAIIGVGKACISSAQEVASLKAQIRSLGEDVDTTYKNLKEFSLTTAGLNTEGVVKAYASFKRLGYSTDEAKSNIQALGKGLASFGTTEGMSGLMIQMEQLSNRTSAFTQDLNAISNYLMDAKSVVKDTFKVENFEDLEKLGVTGKDVANALIQNYSKLSAPQDDINMQMNRLNSTIQDIKASAGQAIQPLLQPLSQVLSILSQIANSSVGRFVMSGAAKFGLVVVGIKAVQTIFDKLSTSIQSASNELQKFNKRSEELEERRARRGPTPQDYRDATSEMLNRPEIAGTGLERDIVLSGMANETVAKARHSNFLQSIIGEKRAKQELLAVDKEIETLEEREIELVLERSRYTNQINELEGSLVLEQSRVLRNTKDIVVNKQKQLSIERQIAKLRDKAQANRDEHFDITTTLQEKEVRRDALTESIEAYRENIKEKTMDGKKLGKQIGNAMIPILLTGLYSFSDYLASKLDESSNKIKEAFSGFNTKTIAELVEKKPGTKALTNEALKKGLDYGITGAVTGVQTGAMIGGVKGAIIGGIGGLVAGAATGVVTAIWGKVKEAKDINRIKTLSDEIEGSRSNRQYERTIKATRESGDTEKADMQQAWLDYKKQAELYEGYRRSNEFDIKDEKDVARVKELQKIKLDLLEEYHKKEKAYQEAQRQKAVADLDLDADIKSLKFKQAGDEFNSQLVLIQRNYQKVIENEKASEKEKEKALLTLQLQTRELENQKALKEIGESGAIKESNFTIQGNKYQAEITKAETEYLKVCNDINSSIADRQLAYNNYAMAVNKANLNEYGRNANLESAKSKYFGYESDIDIMKEYYMTVNDMTSTIQEKETAWYQAKLGLLNKAIDKVKTYYSNYIEGIKSVISKRREMTDSVLSELQRQKDGENSILSEGQAAYLSSGSFDLGNKDSKNYSNEDIMSAYNKVLKDKQDKENLNNQIDAVLYGSSGNSTQGLENMMKSYENMQKYLNDNKTQGLELYKMLSQYLPKLEQTYNLLNNQAQRQMNY